MQNNGSAVHKEQREGVRKVLKVKALLTLEDGETLMARTMDVGGDGLGLVTPKAVPNGAVGMVRFELFHGGKVQSIAIKARAQYCILSNGEFKVGFRFVNLELSAMAAISRFLH